MARLGCIMVVVASMMALQTNAEKGYIMTAPTQFIPGRPEKVCVDLIEVTKSVSIELRLYKTRNIDPHRPIRVDLKDMVDSVNIVISPSAASRCVKMMLPEMEIPPSQLALSIRGEETPANQYSWSFYGQNIIRVLPGFIKTKITVIQTDKPIYKPAQLVQFRIMTLDTRLRPVNEVIDSVHVLAPSGVRMHEWLNTTVRSGLASFEFQLSDEPVEGDYTIFMTRGLINDSKTFNVKDYISPTFEVIIKPPGYALLREELITADICAMYTYGQPVKGTVVGRACLLLPMANLNVRRESFCQEIPSQSIGGCTNVTIDRRLAGWDYRYNDWRNTKLVFNAQVTDSTTGLKRNATATELNFSENEFLINIKGSEFFKPGLPYYTKVLVTTPDGKPAPSIPVTITVSKASIGQLADYTKEYVADAEGAIHVTIPPFIGHSMDITAERPLSAETQKANVSVKAWYSPTGSFLQIIPDRRSQLICGESVTYRVEYTTSAVDAVSMLYKVMGVDDIASSYKLPVTLNTLLRLNHEDPDIQWDTTHNWTTVAIQPNTDVTTSKTINPLQPDFNPAETIVSATAKGSFTLNFTVTSEHSPGGHLVVFYARKDGEVVSDTIPVTLPECTENTVSVSFSKTEVLPGETVHLNLSASPNAVCGYEVVDKSVFVHSGLNYPTLSSIVKRVEAFLLPNNALASTLPINYYCDSLHPHVSEYPGFGSYWQLPTKYREQDSHQGFIKSGLTVTSSFKVKVAPCRRIYYRLRTAVNPEPEVQSSVPIILTPPSFAAGNTAAKPVGYNAPETIDRMASIATTPETATDPESFTISVNRPELEQGTRVLDIVDVRAYFPETMLFDIIETDSAGKASIDFKAPDTITQMIGNAVCSDKEDGVGVSAPITLTSFKPFLLTMKVPHTVVRTEIAPIDITVANYLSTCLALSITIHTPTTVDLMGFNGATRRVCVCGAETVTTTFNVQFDRNQEQTLSATAETIRSNVLCPRRSVMSDQDGLRETVSETVNVIPEGPARDYTKSDYICFDNNGTLVDMVYILPRPSSQRRVPRSSRGFVSVVGDVMGPALTNMHKLLQMPFGCGEQNMLGFTPNIFVLQYLTAIGQATPEIKAKAISHMQSGYQRQFNYVHEDGSYSAFGPNKYYNSSSDTGSMFLTAYVMKSFALAKPFIYIDELQQQRSLQFFIDNQDPSGCFPQLGMVHNRAMKEHRLPGDDNVSLTAYVAIALMEAGFRDVMIPNNRLPKTVVGKAITCIYDNTLRLRSIRRNGYAMTLASYALALYNKTDVRSERTFRRMQYLSSTDPDNNTYWRADRINDRVRTGRYWYSRTVCADVEATSYALMSTLLMRNSTIIEEEAPAIVRWLIRQRNAFGGFGTTQDTVIGMQALTEYGTRYNTNNLNATIEVQQMVTVNNTRVPGPVRASFSINETNRLQHQIIELPSVRSVVLQATGKGCFMFQADVMFNLRAPDSTGQPFVTTVDVRNTTMETRHCSKKALLVCSSYELGEESNLAIVEIRMQSGWAVDEKLLAMMLRFPQLGIKRYDIAPDNTVILYFSKLTNSKRCFYMYVNKEYEVVNAQPAVVQTYDYYKTDERQELTYQIPCL